MHQNIKRLFNGRSISGILNVNFLKDEHIIGVEIASWITSLAFEIVRLIAPKLRDQSSI